MVILGLGSRLSIVTDLQVNPPAGSPSSPDCKGHSLGSGLSDVPLVVCECMQVQRTELVCYEFRYFRQSGYNPLL